MSLFDKYINIDSSNFVNFIGGEFKRQEFTSIISTEYTNKFVIEFKPTDNCNFSCSYCCFHDNTTKHLSDELFSNYLKVLSGMEINEKEIFLFVYGGEPTLHPKLADLIISIVNLFKDKKVNVLIQSNGLYYKQSDYIKLHEKLSIYDIDYVWSFSFHHEHTKIFKIVNIIKYLMSIDRFEVLTYMINKKNIKMDIRNLNIFKTLGIDVYVRTILQESAYFKKSEYSHLISSTPDETPYIIEKNNKLTKLSFENLSMGGFLNFKDYYCTAGNNTILLSSSGKIYRCDMDALYDKNPMYDVNISLDAINSNCCKCEHTFCSIYYSDKFEKEIDYDKKIINNSR